MKAETATTGDTRSISSEQRQNMIATLMLSRGVAMLLGGDEFRRTQDGNNNAYCQDNELSWYDWSLAEKNHELFHFAHAMIDLQRRFSVLRGERFYTAQEIQWFGPDSSTPDWNGADGLLGCLINVDQEANEVLCLLFNATVEPVTFILPAHHGGVAWQRLLETSPTATGNGYNPDHSPSIQHAVNNVGRYTVQALWA